MKRGSFKPRLPRGRRNSNRYNYYIAPALIGLALLSVIMVSFIIFHILPWLPSSSIISSSSISQNDQDLLKVATADSDLIATVIYSQGDAMTKVKVENTGASQFRQVKVVADGGKVLGTLSLLSPKDKTILATKGKLSGVVITAIDQSNREVSGDIRYVEQPDYVNKSDYAKQPEPNVETSFSGGLSSSETSQQTQLNIQAVEEPPKPESVSASQDNLPKFDISIHTNKSSGYQGEMLEFNCKAVNVCSDTLSDVRMFCAGQMTSTTYLIPGKEINLNGTFLINDNMNISAGVQGEDIGGRLWTSNASTKIWLIYPQLNLNITTPDKVHRGEIASLAVAVANTGKNRLTNLSLLDSFGELGRIPLLQPGGSFSLSRDFMLNKSMQYDAQVTGFESSGMKVYGSHSINLTVLTSSLNISPDQSEVTCYSNQPVNITWTLKNTGDEWLKNITLSSGGKRCRLKELLPGGSAKIKGIYIKENTSEVTVTAEGYDSLGNPVCSTGSVFIKTISPAISLKITPPEIEAFRGETLDLKCLVTNTGEDTLANVVLRQNGGALATVDSLAPGEFRETLSRITADANSTIEFRAEGKDSKGKIWSNSVPFNLSIAASGIRALASATISGETASVTCKVTNLGSVALYNAFISSKTFGQLGRIDFLPPNGQRIVTSERNINSDVDDLITIKAFTFEKQPVNTSCRLSISMPKRNPASESKRASRNRGTLPELDQRFDDNRKHISATDIPKSGSIRSAINNTATASGNDLIRDIEGMILYIQSMMGHSGADICSDYNSIGSEPRTNNNEVTNKSNIDSVNNDDPAAYDRTNYDSSNEISDTTDTREETNASRDYELSIASIKGSEHGAISILDISATPPQPAAGQPVKISMHVKSANAVRSAKAKWGISDVPLTKEAMMDVNRIHIMPMTLISGENTDGYWSCTIPGRSGGTYMALSVVASDGSSSVEDGPFLLHWSTVRSNEVPGSVRAIASSGKGRGMLFIESTVVNGKGDVSIKDNIADSAVSYYERMKGNGSINFESEKCIDKSRPGTNFTEKRDIVFTGGILKGQKTLESPRFDGGMGASVTERFNLSHVDKSETNMVRNTNNTYNTLAYSTDQAFDGDWNIQTRYSEFYKKMKADQQYTGSFQTRKKIQFDDQGK